MAQTVVGNSLIRVRVTFCILEGAAVPYAHYRPRPIGWPAAPLPSSPPIILIIFKTVDDDVAAVVARSRP